MISRSAAVLCLALLLPLAESRTLYAAPAHSPWPGGIAIVDIGSSGEPRPDVAFADKAVMVMAREGRWFAVVGIPLDTDAESLTIDVAGDDVSIELIPREYREQRLTVKNQSYVTPGQQQLERIGAERKIIDAALTRFRAADSDGIALAAPVSGPRSSSFGLRRFFNEQPRAPHKGMDIAAPEGEPIVAPRQGVVSASGDFFFNGKTVIVDHGQGFVTMYCHLSEIAVENGQVLLAGELLGKVGATGRVTGPHLHFGTYLNGTAVDPAILLTSP
ncbi:MAG: peptidoglycan DD-metalloendopeptidase family protein [Woeseiaceae bacterium]